MIMDPTDVAGAEREIPEHTGGFDRMEAALISFLPATDPNERVIKHEIKKIRLMRFFQ
jgi:hypothetical protein